VNPNRGERMATELETDSAGVVDGSSFMGLGPSMAALNMKRMSVSLHEFARFTAVTALFSVEVAPSYPLGGWNLASIVKT